MKIFIKKIILLFIWLFSISLPIEFLPVKANIQNENTELTIIKYKKIESKDELIIGKKIILVDIYAQSAISTENINDKAALTAIVHYEENNKEYVNISKKVQVFELCEGIGKEFSFYCEKGYFSYYGKYFTTNTDISSFNIKFDNNNDLIPLSSQHYTTDGKTLLLYIECEGEDLTIPPVIQNYDGKIVTIKEAIQISINAGSSYTTEKYIIQGELTSIYNTEYGNATLFDQYGDYINIYGMYADDGKTKYESINTKDKPYKGDYVILYGKLGTHNSNPEMHSSYIVFKNSHEHVYSNYSDKENHYSKCLYCDDFALIEKHNFKTEIIEPTCTQSGYTKYTCDCKYTYYVDYVEPTNHMHDTITYTWSADYKYCTAFIDCEELEFGYSYSSYSTIEVEGECNKPGIVKYVVEYPNTDYPFENQVKEVYYEEIPHFYKVSDFEWNDDYSKITLTLTCKLNCGYTTKEEYNTKTYVVQQATCTSTGIVIYYIDEYSFYVEHQETIPITHNLYCTDLQVKNDGTIEKTFKCSDCSYTTTKIINENNDGCKGNSTSFISLIILLIFLLIKYRLFKKIKNA